MMDRQFPLGVSIRNQCEICQVVTEEKMFENVDRWITDHGHQSYLHTISSPVRLQLIMHLYKKFRIDHFGHNCGGAILLV